MALMHVSFFSEVLGMSTQAEVILPEVSAGQIGTDAPDRRGSTQVLYLLHGLSDDQTIWQRRTGIERYVSGRNLAVIMPTTHRGWYTDMYMGPMWFTYVSEELPRIMCRLFPCLSQRREDTFVCGLSMGGYGALKIGLSKPERFACAASLSGAVDAEELTRNGSVAGRREFEDVFGPLESIRGSENDLFHLADVCAEKAVRPRLYMCCGLQDGLYGQNAALRAKLTEKGYDLTYEEEDGTHCWDYWDMKIQSVLSWLYGGKERG